MKQDNFGNSNKFDRRTVLTAGVRSAVGIAGISAISGTVMATNDTIMCPKTPGYWKNHKDNWSEDKIWLGYGFVSPKEAMAILDQPPKGDKCTIMAHQLIAAIQNVREGKGGQVTFDVSCVNEDPDTIQRAQLWLQEHCGDSSVKGPWPGDGEEIKNRLDAFNNGELCPDEC